MLVVTPTDAPLKPTDAVLSFRTASLPLTDARHDADGRALEATDAVLSFTIAGLSLTDARHDADGRALTQSAAIAKPTSPAMSLTGAAFHPTSAARTVAVPTILAIRRVFPPFLAAVEPTDATFFVAHENKPSVFVPTIVIPPRTARTTPGMVPGSPLLTVDPARIRKENSQMGTNTNSKAKGTKAVLAAKLAAGAQKHFPAGMSMSVGGVMLTLAQIETQLTGFASLRTDVDTARSDLQAKLAAETAQATAMNAFLDAFVRLVRGSFGNQPDVLADFGLPPEKARTPLTVEQKAAAAAKRAATRVARGTTGRKAKLAVKGNVTGVVVTPVTTAKAAQPAAATVTTGTSAPGSNQAPSATATPTPHS
jgi:hypothetical protein